MANILDGLTPVRVLPKKIDAECYNRIRVRLLRGMAPLRVALPDHRGLDVILTDAAWLCVDSTRNDQPILSWSQFEIAERTALHEPVACQLSLYHIHAGLIMGSALEALATADRTVTARQT